MEGVRLERPRGRAAPRPSCGTAKRLDARGLDREPLNAETPLELLSRTTITPTELFFVRTHGAVPEVDPTAYRLTVNGLVREPLDLSLEELRRFERVELAAALQCAGNRRDELAAVSPIPGQVPWGAGAVGNAIWGGVRLRDLLEVAGPEVDTGHVAFTGLDEVEEEGELLTFGGSIPLETAVRANVLLADEMNGEPLHPSTATRCEWSCRGRSARAASNGWRP